MILRARVIGSHSLQVEDKFGLVAAVLVRRVEFYVLSVVMIPTSI